MNPSVSDPALTGKAFDVAAVGATERIAIDALPVIDMSPFLRDSTLAERMSVARQLRAACIDIGFFYLSGHGFSSGEFAALMGQARRFFELPMEQKMSISAKDNPASLGFIRTGGLDPDKNVGLRPDLKERLFASRELSPGELHDDKSPAGRSQWPSAGILPGFEDTARAYIARTVELARTLSRVFSLSLNLPEYALDRFHDRMACNYAFNYYPPSPPDQDQSWGFTPHTDYGSFTILMQDDSGGLQARNAAGTWIEVPPLEETFVVNVGDLLARWTNDLYVSTLHRVINRTSASRLSISFFAVPNPRAEIAVLESCQSDARPAMYPPVGAGDYCAELLAQAFRTGRTGVSQRTAERLNKGD